MKKKFIAFVLATALILPLAGGRTITAQASATTSSYANRTVAAKKNTKKTVKIPKFSAKKYNKIKKGMTYEEALKILGTKEFQKQELIIDGKPSKSYLWMYTDKDITIYTDENDQINQKVLTSPNKGSKKTVKVTQEQFDSVKSGMTYDQVKEIFGGAGKIEVKSRNDDYELLGNNSSTQTDIYQWDIKGKGDSQYYELQFTDGKILAKSIVTKNSEKSSKITTEDYKKVKMGMSYETVLGILGTKENEKRKSIEFYDDGKEYITYSYTWKIPSGCIFLAFNDNNEAYQGDLDYDPYKTKSKVKATKEQYDKIQDGMTYEQVKEILGSDGRFVSNNEVESGGLEVYEWQGKNIGGSKVYYTVYFENGVVSVERSITYCS